MLLIKVQNEFCEMLLRLLDPLATLQRLLYFIYKKIDRAYKEQNRTKKIINCRIRTQELSAMTPESTTKTPSGYTVVGSNAGH